MNVEKVGQWSVAIVAILMSTMAMLLYMCASCAPVRSKSTLQVHECRNDFLDDNQKYPECNAPDPCICERPWAPETDGCCRRTLTESALKN